MRAVLLAAAAAWVAPPPFAGPRRPPAALADRVRRAPRNGFGVDLKNISETVKAVLYDIIILMEFYYYLNNDKYFNF